MALRDEQADILGGPILQRPESSLFASFGQYHFVFKLVTLLGLGLLVWIMCVYGLEYLKKHRELSYRKAMRRKHGIPDSDCRPFAVAYAAAKRAHLEREAQDRKRMATNYVSDHHSPAVDQRTDALKDTRGLRKRVPETTLRLYDYQLPTNHTAVYDKRRPYIHPLNFADRYNPNSRRDVAIPEPLPTERVPVCRTGRRESALEYDEIEESRKRSFEDESDVELEIIKKSRIDGEELIDGDEEADWYAQYSDVPLRQTSRASLHRQLEADYVHANGQGRSQPINDLHNEDRGPADELMEAVGEDEVTELMSVVRGRKRDRAEAESSFGGDEDEDSRNGRASHHRKRRTVSQRRVEVPARGRKRDREAESPESEGERCSSEVAQGRPQRSSKKKRGKKVTPDLREVSMVYPCVSRDPLCVGRRIAEEWEADGVRYKVSDKGEPLRLTLVKKARNKYHMPEDSQHPDRSAALEIYVETWMTDEQYRQAEERQELVWQEAPRKSKHLEVLDSPTKAGKNILWDSVTGSPARPFRHLAPASTSTRINPFEQWQLQPTLQGRRVASSSATVSPMLPGVADSPTRPGFRTFSKWEKQDREAEAMARIRAKIEEQKRAQSPPQRSGIPTSVTAPELGSKPLSVPMITLTPALPVAVDGQSKTNTSIFFEHPPSTNDPTKSTPTATSSATPTFSLPSVSTHASTPSMLLPSASVVSSDTSSTTPIPQFSFAKSSQVPRSASTVSSLSTMPTFFGKGTSVTSGSIPSPVSGAKSDVSTSSATSSPAITVPLATKSQGSIFGSTSTSSPSTVNPGSIKAEASTSLPVLTSATTSESLKSATPLFSLSGTSSSLSTTTFPAPSVPSIPKFSFAQSSTTLGFTPVPNASLDVVSQPKPTFKFGLAPTSAADGGSTSSIPAMPVSVFGTSAISNEPTQPSGTAPTEHSIATSPLGKLVATADGASIFVPPKPTSGPASLTNAFLSTPAGIPTSANTQGFSFGETSSGSKAVEGSKPSSGGATASPSSVPIFNTEGKPTFAFGTSREAFKPASTSSSNPTNSKPPSVFGGLVDGPKLMFAFGGPAETAKPNLVFGGGAEGSQPTFGVPENKFNSGPAAENSKSSDTTVGSRPNVTPDSTTSAARTFAFGKEDATTNSTSMGVQTKPPTSFTFGASSGATSSIFGKAVNTTPSAFGFAGSSGSSAFTFSKPTTQNQKQEQ